MSTLGARIKELRIHNGVLLRQVAAYLEVDTALISKIEKGTRVLNRQQISQIAQFLKTSEEELTILWLCDKVLDTVKGQPLAINGIQRALIELNK